MTQQLSGFPYWQVQFDEAGQFVEPAAIETFLQEVGKRNLTDLFIFSHGWNNDQKIALDLYTRFFAQLREVFDQLGSPGVSRRREATLGLVGVIWPSMRWLDEDANPSAASGAASLGGAAAIAPPPSDAELVKALKDVFHSPQQKKAIDELAQLLTNRPETEAALARFQELMRPLTATPDAVVAEEDNGESSLLGDRPEVVYKRFADAAPSVPSEGGDAGFMDQIRSGWNSIWGGAKEALRQATYWEMKKRAGVVGQTGLGPLIGRIQEAQQDLRVQLLGHSFGARLVSFALTGLPGGPTGAASPVKSVFLLEGAFSHFAFTKNLPFAPTKNGALADMIARVDGPISVTYSKLDSAVTVYYPIASLAANDAASGLLEDFRHRWGGMGYDGAQNVSAASTPLLPVGQEYDFALTPGLFVNLDGNRVIINGTGPAGAHSDIVHPEIAWSALLNAGIAGGTLAGGGPSAGAATGGAADLESGAAETAPPAPSSTAPPKPITHRLLRVGVISEAFGLTDEAERMRVGVHKDAKTAGPVMVELNLLHAKGLQGAKESFRKLFMEVTGITVGKDPDDPNLTEITNTYFRCLLSVEQIHQLVQRDQAGATEGGVKNRSVYRIWPDFPVEPFVDRSVSTVKGDAARRSYDASGEGITWAVIDSGVDVDHPHFATHDTLEGGVASLHWDFTAPGKPLSNPLGTTTARKDDLGHGTHVAGIIAGSLLDPMKPTLAPPKFYVGRWADDQLKPIQERVGVDPNRLHGVAPLCKLISLRVLAAGGQSYSSNVIRALQFIREELNGNGKLLRVHGVNLSLGYEFNAKWFACGQSPICVEVDRLVRSGVVVVIAAGNTGYGVLRAQQRDTSTGMSLTINDPGNSDLAITVGSTHRDSPHTYGISYFSSKGPTGDGRLKPDLVAPGERITSCAAGKNLELLRGAGVAPAEARLAAYLDDSGTSMAAPHVSGAVAAFLSIRREFIGQPEKVKELFLKTATTLGRERYFEGYGLVDLMRAIQAV